MIIPFFWRLLPGPVWLRAVFALAIVAGIVWLLFTEVFPWVSSSLNLDGGGLDGAGQSESGV